MRAVSCCAAYSAFSRTAPPAGGNVVRGVLWAPDGSCLLSASEDCALRLFELPADACGAPMASELETALQIEQGESVYDYCWYPLMRSAEPLSCCVLSSCRDHPIRMWDAYDGSLRASYSAYNHLDELTTAYSLAFNPSGCKIYCGFERCIRVFDVTRPGRQIEDRPTTRTRKARDGQRGILSCLAFAPDGSGLFAAGSFAGSTAVYSEDSRELVTLLGGHAGGITQVLWTHDGQYLLTGARRDGRILCWDVRKTCAPLCSYERLAPTNQRIGFDLSINSETLVTGSQDGAVRAYNVYQPECPPAILMRYTDAVNGVSLHPSLPLIAVAVGERTFPLQVGDVAGDLSDGIAGDGLDIQSKRQKAVDETSASEHRVSDHACSIQDGEASRMEVADNGIEVWQLPMKDGDYVATVDPSGTKQVLADEGACEASVEVHVATACAETSDAPPACPPARHLPELTVVELRKELKERGLPCHGRKHELVTRLQETNRDGCVMTSANTAVNVESALALGEEVPRIGGPDNAASTDDNNTRLNSMSDPEDETAALAAYRARLLETVNAMSCIGAG